MANYKLKYKGAEIDRLLDNMAAIPSQFVARTDISNHFATTQTITGSDDTPLNLSSSHATWCNIAFINKSGTRMGNIGVNNGRPYWWGLSGSNDYLVLSSELNSINLSNYVDLTSTQQITGQKDFDVIYATTLGLWGSSSKYAFGMDDEIQMFTPNNKIRLTDTVEGDAFDYTFPQHSGNVVVTNSNGNIDLDSLTKGIVNKVNSGFGFTDDGTPCIRNPRGRILSMSISEENFEDDFLDYIFPDDEGTLITQERVNGMLENKADVGYVENLQQATNILDQDFRLLVQDYDLLKRENEELKSRIQTLEDAMNEIKIKLGI